MCQMFWLNLNYARYTLSRTDPSKNTLALLIRVVTYDVRPLREQVKARDTHFYLWIDTNI